MIPRIPEPKRRTAIRTYCEAIVPVARLTGSPVEGTFNGVVFRVSPEMHPWNAVDSWRIAGSGRAWWMPGPKAIEVLPVQGGKP